MSFSQTNSIRLKKQAVKDNIASLPKTIASAQSLIEETFTLFDSIGKNLVNLAVFNIDPDLLDKFDQDFKQYSLKKSELNSLLSDITRISSSLSETDTLFNSEGGSVINDSVINDFQSILDNINETIGSDINTKLEELKLLKTELETINTEVKQPVEQINESLQLFKKTTDISFEIFTKSTLESLKNSVEMRTISENLEDRLFDLEESANRIPEQVQNSLKDEIRSVVNESMVNLDVKIQKILEEKLKDIKLTFSSEIANMIDQKFNTLLDTLTKVQPKTEVPVQRDEPLSRDMQEINIFLKWLYTWPTEKDDILKKIEEFRDTLLVKRTNDPPFRVTATNIFRESISEISREERHINQNKLREIIQLYENLKRTIEGSER